MLSSLFRADRQPGQSSPALAANACWLAVAAISLLPLVLARLPPLYDYYQWMFQGYLVSRLLPWGSGSDEVAVLYGLSGVPVPNLLAPVGIALLNTVFSPANAARAFLVLGVLGFGRAFAYLVRSSQGRPSALELAGFPWAYGYFMYRGYHGYLFGVGLALAVIAKLHRSVEGSERGPGRADLLLLTFLGAALYLCHLLAWLPYVGAVGVYALLLLRRGQGRQMALLLATLAPSLLMLLVYTRASAEEFTLGLYRGLADKAVSIEALSLFSRIDPFPSLLPVFWLNIVAMGLLAVVLVANLERDQRRQTTSPLVVVGLLVLAAGLLTFVSSIRHCNRPDERFLLAGLLIVVAGLRHRPFLVRRGLPVVLVVSIILTIHAVEYRRASGNMEQIKAAIGATVPRGATTVSLVVSRPRVAGSCKGEPGVSSGIQTLKWLDLQRLIENGGVRGQVVQTSLLQTRIEHSIAPLEVSVLRVKPEELRSDVLAHSRFIQRHSYVEIFGCREDVAAAREALAPTYDTLREGEWFAILRRRREVQISHPEAVAGAKGT